MAKECSKPLNLARTAAEMKKNHSKKAPNSENVAVAHFYHQLDNHAEISFKIEDGSFFKGRVSTLDSYEAKDNTSFMPSRYQQKHADHQRLKVPVCTRMRRNLLWRRSEPNSIVTHIDTNASVQKTYPPTGSLIVLFTALGWEM